jgi:hypothetical protein
LRKRLEAVLDGEEPPAIKRPAKPDVLMKALPVQVRSLEAAAKTVTAIEVVAADRKGLLASLAAAIAEAAVQGAGCWSFPRPGWSAIRTGRASCRQTRSIRSTASFFSSVP